MNFILTLSDYVTITLVAYIIGIACAVLALWRVRTAQGTAAWVVSLIGFPFLTVPFFLIFGRNKFYKVRLRRSRLDKKTRQFVNEIDKVYSEEVVALSEVSPLVRLAHQIDQPGFTQFNSLQLLIDGEATYEALLKQIQEAKEYILFQYYIFQSDHVGERFAQALIDKVKQGVKVYFLYDSIGKGLSWSMRRKLIEGGVDVSFFRSTSWIKLRFQVNFRNHRKIVVIDGQTAFVGGLNIGSEYIGEHKKLTPWRDTHLMLKGPAALSCQLSFLKDWYWSCEKIPKLNWFAHHEKSDSQVLVLPTGPADDIESCLYSFLTLIHSAQKRIFISTPYLVPSEGLMNALCLASLRGVEVEIMVPGMNDNFMIWHASKVYLEKLVQAGAKVFSYKKGFIHQKVALFDESWAMISSTNLDSRSLFINFEIYALTNDASIIIEMKSMIEKDKGVSVKIGKEYFLRQTFFQQLLSRFFALFSPML